MYDANMYLLEKQAYRPKKPMSRAKMIRFYGQVKSTSSGPKNRLLVAVGNGLIAAGQKLRAKDTAEAAMTG